MVTNTTRPWTESKPATKSTYPKGRVLCSADTFVKAESLVLPMKFSGKNQHLRQAAKRYVLL